MPAAAADRLPSPPPRPPVRCCWETVAGGDWKRLLFAGLQYALALLATVATLAVTMDAGAWFVFICRSDQNLTLAAGSRGLTAQPDWSSLAACSANFVSVRVDEETTWTAVNWLLVTSSVTCCCALIVLILGSFRSHQLARLLPIMYLILAPFTCGILISVLLAAAISAKCIESRLLQPTTATMSAAVSAASVTISGSIFPAQLAAITAAAVATAAGAAALPLRRVLLASRSYDVTLAAAAAAALSEADTVEVEAAEASSEAEAEAGAGTGGKRGTRSEGGSSAYQAAESVDDCVSEMAGDEPPISATAPDGCAGCDNCAMDRRLSLIDAV